MKNADSGIFNSALQIAQERAASLQKLRDCFDAHNYVEALSLSRILCGLEDPDPQLSEIGLICDVLEDAITRIFSGNDDWYKLTIREPVTLPYQRWVCLPDGDEMCIDDIEEGQTYSVPEELEICTICGTKTNWIQGADNPGSKPWIWGKTYVNYWPYVIRLNTGPNAAKRIGWVACSEVCRIRGQSVVEEYKQRGQSEWQQIKKAKKLLQQVRNLLNHKPTECKDHPAVSPSHHGASALATISQL